VNVTAIVLAAGAATRFGGAKLLAPLDGRPVLQHVLDAVAEAGLGDVVVVLGHGAEAIEGAITWRTERRVRNPDPELGLASSLRIGSRAVASHADAAVVLLGDQPRVRTDVIRRLLAGPIPAGAVFVTPRYERDAAPNPVLVLRAAWPLVDALSGDRGLGPFIESHPELVHRLPVEGDNPDVDTRADLAVLAWAAQVRANSEQVDRVREVPDGPDFYGPVSSLFRADPHRSDDPTLDALLALARPDDVWLDIGAGAGRFALPLALRVREVIAVDPSASMLDALREGMAEHGIANIRTIEGRWPIEPSAAGGTLAGDVALIAHVGYDIEQVGTFLAAMEAAARRLCVAVLMERQPSSIADPFWPPIHGEEREPLPALGSFVELLRARGRDPDVRMVERRPRAFASHDELARFIRRQLWVEEGGEKDGRMLELLDAWTVELDGGIGLRDQRPLEVGVVTWSPGRRAIAGWQRCHSVPHELTRPTPSSGP
jgi:molybdenum cofactor cytidylyltransferase